MKRREFGKILAAAGAMLTAGSVVRDASAAPATKKRVENTPVILECAINGGTSKARNPLAPETVEEHVAEISKCLDAGVSIVHSHSNHPNPDPKVAAQFYTETYRPIRKKYPHAILYATANFDPKVYNQTRHVWASEVQCGHHLILAEAGLANMVLLDTGVAPLAGYDDQGVPGPDSSYFWYGFWPDDIRYIQRVCKQTGAGASISVFEPGWMKNVVAMVRAGTLPRGSKLNIYFAPESFASLAPPIPEALELYLKMMEGLDLKWSVGNVGNQSIMDTPLARMALERGGSFRVGLEDWGSGPSNLEQIKRAKEMINAVGRPIVTGAEAIKFLDIPFAATRPKS
ncbi:MAG: 3-keto-5-aminohexanoate cleavage protein, partial [Gammaproteobacteria bacterium]